MQFMNEYPSGEFQVITRDFKPLVNGKLPYRGIIKVIHKTLFALISVQLSFHSLSLQCRILPPQDLRVAILGVKEHSGLHFGLCRACILTMEKGECCHTDEAERALIGTWVTAEVDEALRNGYKLLEIKEIYHWDVWHNEFYKDFIRTFLKIKVSMGIG